MDSAEPLAPRQKPELDVATARQWFTLDDLGRLRWRARPGQGVRAGDLAGCTHRRDGQRVVKFRGRVYQGDRVVHLLVHGAWPRDRRYRREGG